MIDNKYPKKQSGVALIQVLLISAIITVMALRLSYNARNQVGISATFEERAQAQLKLSSAQANVMFTLLTQSHQNTEGRNTAQNAHEVTPQWNYYGKPFNLEPDVTVKINDHRGLIPQRLPSSTLWEDFLTREEVNEQQQKLMLARLNDWQYQKRVTESDASSALKTTEKGIAYPFRSIQLPQEVSFIFPNELHQQLQELTSHYAHYTFNPLNAPDPILLTFFDPALAQLIIDQRENNALDVDMVKAAVGNDFAEESISFATGQYLRVVFNVRYKQVMLKETIELKIEQYTNSPLLLLSRY